MRYLFVFLTLLPALVFADDALLQDRNGDGVIKIATFGDSITYGIGDGEPVGVFIEVLPEGTRGPGYPGRLTTLLGVPVQNGGFPGETLTEGGAARFPAFLASSKADVVVILEGVNDAVFRVTTGAYARSLQRVINVARALGVEPVVATILNPDASHVALAPFTDAYSLQVQDIASVNEISLIELERAWRNTCQNKMECELYNSPEGLHPNTKGYDVISQVVAAKFVGVDIFSPNGATELESALGLSAGAVLVKPDGVFAP